MSYPLTSALRHRISESLEKYVRSNGDKSADEAGQLYLRSQVEIARQ